MLKRVIFITPTLFTVLLLSTFVVHYNTTSRAYDLRSNYLNSEDSSAPTIQWVYTSEGYGFGRDACQTSDGGYILVGSTLINTDIWLIKIDADGNETWSRTFTGDGSEYGNSVRQTKDGGYIIAGEIGTPYEEVPAELCSIGNRYKIVEPTGIISINMISKQTDTGDSDIWLIKTDSEGNEIWNQRFGGYSQEESRSVRQTKDGGYIITGYTTSRSAGDVLLIKTDAEGNEIWSRTYGGGSIDMGNDVNQTADGGYIITGRTTSLGDKNSNVCLIKTDKNGDEVWSRNYGGSGSEYGNSVRQTKDGGYIITGYTTSYGAGKRDLWLIKTDIDGNLIWSKTFGMVGDDVGKSVCQTASGGYIIAGYTDSYAQKLDDVWLIKTDANGNISWKQTFDANGNEYGSSVIQTSDWGYVVAGQSSSRMMLLKYKPDSAEVGIPFHSSGLISPLFMWLIIGILSIVAVSAIIIIIWRNYHRS